MRIRVAGKKGRLTATEPMAGREASNPKPDPSGLCGDSVINLQFFTEGQGFLSLLANTSTNRSVKRYISRRSRGE